jgi:uncharacterized damage-inducible protein DinB
MTISERLLPEFDQEMANTRILLARVPDNKADWKPHEKSMMLGALAAHIAQLPSWATRIVDTETLDLAPVLSGGYKPYVANSAEELLRSFDKNVTEAREALTKAGDEHLDQIWTIQVGEKTITSGPRIQMIHSMFMNHLIHHRAQLGVYLRLNDVPLPALYGPSADEGQSMFGGK